MFIHITPRLYNPKGVPCRLVDVSIPALGLRLVGDRDVVARRPFPNKDYWVACRKEGRKAVSGVLLRSTQRLAAYSVVTRWAIGAQFVSTHVVDYAVLDEDYSLVSDEMTMWGAWAGAGNVSRWPQDLQHLTPMEAAPCMDVEVGRVRKGRAVDTSEGFSVLRRHETISQHTLEMARFPALSVHSDRLPTLASAFYGAPHAGG